MTQFEANPTPVRERNLLRRRRDIMAAARRIVASDGVKGLSMRRLADEADVALKTLYNLCGTKDEIMKDLVAGALDLIHQDQEVSGVLDQLKPLDGCRELVLESIRRASSDEDLFRALVRSAYEAQPLLNDNYLSLGRTQFVQRQTRLIVEAIQAGDLEDKFDPEMLALQIHHGIRLAIVDWAFGLIDKSDLRDRALLSLYVTLRSVATRKSRLKLEKGMSGIAI